MKCTGPQRRPTRPGDPRPALPSLRHAGRAIPGWTAPRRAAACLVAAAALAACDGGGAASGRGPTGAYADSGWPTIHADPRNSDSTRVAGSRNLALAFHVLADRPIAAGATVGPEGHVYVGVGLARAGAVDGGCYLFALDERTGATLWCSGEVNDRAVTSSPLVDRAGDLYIGDNRAMVSFTSEGTVRWRTAIEGFPVSAQFTPDGRLIFLTHIGRIYVLERATGALALPTVEALPGASYEPAPLDYLGCLAGSAESACYVANTLSIDPATGRFFFTLTDPASPPTQLVALRYVAGTPPRIEPLWENAALEGGSSSSPDISFDGRRLYVNDRANHVLALDASSGQVLWTFDLGFSPLGSLSTEPGGRIVPTGALGAPALALADRGTGAELLWRSEEIESRSIAVQTGNDLAYIAGTRPGSLVGLDLFVVDVRTGELLDTEPFSPGAVTTGTTMSRSGRVFVPTLFDGLYGFAPAG